ncbi:AtrD, ABC-transporter [Mollisia scopiformis]|uniref:AtrD, ABC-transporter n=1 Tax=Mollisia scopiformis TaxID=149040 RepID=A0A194WU93_MOLSC|nr:AtrD, ABC-transporter [Mollisia scopiformis]KUJ11528.1 AtrD, ABC-transporter [Mollisia scopiformis]
MDSIDEEDAIQKWIQYVQQQHQRFRRSFGICFENLTTEGVQTDSDYQNTFGSYLLAIPEYFGKVLSGRKQRRVRNLERMDGLVKGGEMLLVLGRPGSGCSTFLKTIAGAMHGLYIGDGSNINYQGLSYDERHNSCKVESIYVAELDIHFPELTLGKTLEFAASTRSSSSGKDYTPRLISQLAASMFNLQEAFNTPVGDDMIRGISGGEKKRTSIAEAFMSGSQIQCWDNSTRGLDSSTALDLVAMLRAVASELGSLILVSVYQASDTIYNKFDKVMLLYEGRQIFFGSSHLAVSYFTSLGFIKPAKITSADFLTSITNPIERIIAPGYERRVPLSPEEFALAWKQSKERKSIQNSIIDYNYIHPMKPENLANYQQDRNRLAGFSKHHTSQYSLSIIQQIGICLSRAYQRLMRNPTPTISAITGNAIMGIVLGSVFYNLDDSNASMDRRSILLFFSIMLNACTSAFFQILTIWVQRPIVEKHSLYSFCHPFTDACGSMICDLPNKLLTSILFNLALYFMSNLRRTASAFLTYYLFCFATLLTMSMVFRMMGSLSKRIEQSMAPGSILVLSFIIYTGFVIPIPYMVPWFGWISVMINEGRSNTTTCSSIGAKPGQSFIEGIEYLWVKYRYPPDHLWRNVGFLFVFMIGYCAVYLLAVEYIPTKRLEGEILLFKRKNLSKSKLLDDEEGNAADVPKFGEKKEDTCPTVTVLQDTNTEIFLHKLPPQTGQFHWNNVSYDVQVDKGDTKRILNEVDGWVKPGTVTALMGATRAGKTTLLDVLAARTSVGIVSGDIYVNGKRSDRSLQRQTGYVQQADIHVPTATVREALVFSAVLRQPGRTRSTDEKREYVEQVLNVLEMQSYADAVVGVPGEGLNIEQRRRLSIAVEMIAKPGLLLFFDEPTSGLDSQTAWSICTLLRRLADHGQAVLCTIHQPSAQLFEVFDQLLLERGGCTLYFGEIGRNESTMIRYFEMHGARACQPSENPAEWMLDVTGATPRSKNTISWAENWKESAERREVKRQLEALLDVDPANLSLESCSSDNDDYAASHLNQLLIVTHRAFQEYWRTPSYLYSKLALCVGAAIFNGFSFYMSPYDIQGLTNIVFSIFLLTNIFASVDQQIIPRFIESRSRFEARERKSKSYSWIVFVASQLLVKTAWQTLTAILEFVAWYNFTGVWRNGGPGFNMNERAGLSFVFIWLFCVFASTFSQAVAATNEHAETAVNIAQLFFYLCVIFCGVIVQPAQLPGFWKFMYRVSPLTYLIHGMASATLGNANITCSSIELVLISPPSNTSCREYLSSYILSAGGYLVDPMSELSCLFCPITEANPVLASFGIHVHDRWRDYGIFCVYSAINVVATFILYRRKKK